MLRVWSVAFSHDGQTIVSGGEDGKLFLRSSSDGSTIDSLVDGPHSPSIYAVAFSPDDQWLAIAAETSIMLHPANYNSSPIIGYGAWTATTRNLTFSPDGKLFALVNTDGSVRLLSVDEQRQRWEFQGTAAQSEGLFGIAFSPDGTLLATSDADEPIKLWRVPTE
jgi:WD40 repeat protein